MTKAEFISKIVEATGYRKKDITAVLDATRDIVWNALKNKDKVTVFDSIILRTQYTDERTCRNPRTGESMTVPAKYVLRAKFGKKIKDFVNE